MVLLLHDFRVLVAFLPDECYAPSAMSDGKSR